MRTLHDIQPTLPNLYYHIQASPCGRMCLLSISLLLWTTACQPWQDPTTDLPEFSAVTLDSLAQVDMQLASIADLRDRAQLDSLLRWTALLKDKNSEAALTYARESVRLATDAGDQKDQAVGRYYVALLEGRYQVYREGLADPFVNAEMAVRLWPVDDESLWPLKFQDLLGELFFRKNEWDSAKHYFQTVQNKLAHDLSTKEEISLKSKSLHSLGNVAYKQREYTKADSLFRLADKYYSAVNDRRGQGVLRYSQARLLEKQKLLDSTIIQLEASLLIGEEIEDTYVITNALQGLGNVYMKKYRADKNLTDFEKSRSAFRRSQTYDEENPYYTNGRLAMLLQSRASRDIKRVDLVDSAVVLYKLSLEQARKRGALDYFKKRTRELTKLCDWLQQAQGRDCAFILEASTADYLYNNYSGIVDTITHVLAEANTNRLSAELDQQEAANIRRLRTNWFASGGAVLMASLVFLLLWQKQKQRRLEARMEALRAQINPHFFSNSLNAIESLVNLDQRKAASKYLIHFSRLTRRVLNSSLEPTTSLKGELATTEHFLVLEQLRFKDKLYYDIEIDPSLSPEMVEVPSLILQPYLENAIWHGIKPKTVPSLLQIKIKQKGKKLCIIIQDDGIGREAAAQQQEGSVLKRKSHGMRITKERLRRFGGGKVEIEDLYTEAGQARGTRVHLELPLRHLKPKKTSALARKSA